MKLFKLEVTIEGFGGTDQENEVDTNTVIENDNLKIAKENLERIKATVSLARKIRQGDSMYKLREIPKDIEVPSFIKISKDGIESVMFLNDDRTEEEYGVYNWFSGYYGGEIISAQIAVSEMKYEF